MATFATTLTVADLATRVRKDPGDEDVIRSWKAALALLGTVTEDAYRDIPPDVADDMALKVARAIWDNNKQPSQGGPQATQVQGEGVARAPRDPLAVVAATLSRYTMVGLA